MRMYSLEQLDAGSWTGSSSGGASGAGSAPGGDCSPSPHRAAPGRIRRRGSSCAVWGGSSPDEAASGASPPPAPGAAPLPRQLLRRGDGPRPGGRRPGGGALRTGDGGPRRRGRVRGHGPLAGGQKQQGAAGADRQGSAGISFSWFSHLRSAMIDWPEKKPSVPLFWDERQPFRGTTRIRVSRHALMSGNGGRRPPLRGRSRANKRHSLGRLSAGGPPLSAICELRYFPVLRIYHYLYLYHTHGKKQA